MTATLAHDLSVSLDIAEPAWIAALPEAERVIETAAVATVRLACPGLVDAEISIILIDDNRQRELNRVWRAQDRSTNVLSFPALEIDAGSIPEPEFRGIPLVLGDISLALETIRAEANVQRKPLADHVAHLVSHGVLHLLGYDHVNDAQAVVMEALEIEILAGLGIADPYALADEGEMES